MKVECKRHPGSKKRLFLEVTGSGTEIKDLIQEVNEWVDAKRWKRPVIVHIHEPFIVPPPPYLGYYPYNTRVDFGRTTTNRELLIKLTFHRP